MAVREGAVRVLSVCAGDGRDVLGVLAERDDAARMRTTLLELHPGIAQQAAEAARATGLDRVEVRVADAGDSDTYVGLVPADVVIMVGVFGNIADADVERTIRTTPQFCAPGATLLWSRGRHIDDRNDAVRGWFAEVGFTELDYAADESGSRAALGALQFTGTPEDLVPGRRLFTFLR